METGVAPVRTWKGLAILAAILGLLSLVFWLVAGSAALVVGYLALYHINQSDGAQRGERLAWMGLILGAVGCLLQALWFVAIIVASLVPYQARTVDSNHLRQIGLALNQYHDSNDNWYPPAVSARSNLVPQARLSWLVLQLPYLEQRQGGLATFTALAGKLDLSAGYADEVNAPARQPLRAYQSPSAPENAEEPAFTSYVGLAGVGPEALALSKDNPRAGFFGYDRRIGRDDLKAGTSFTMTATETTRGGPWAQGGPRTTFEVPATGDDLIGPGRPFGGLHREGLHILFADGSVSFRRSDLQPALLRKQVCINHLD